MIQTGYTKLFGSIVASTIWRESHPTRIVWITLLALSDSRGFVAGSIPGLADLAHVTVDECEQALSKLQEPDRYSRSPQHEGRRIKVADGGWLILNRTKYRDLIPEEYRREKARLRQRKHRDHLSPVTKRDSHARHAASHQKEKEEEKEENKMNTKGADALCEWIPTEAWAGYVEMRNISKKPLTDRAAGLILDKLQRLRNEGNDPALVLDQSVRNGWQDVFPLRLETNGCGTLRPSDVHLTRPSPAKNCPLEQCDGSGWYVSRETRKRVECGCRTAAQSSSSADAESSECEFTSDLDRNAGHEGSS